MRVVVVGATGNVGTSVVDALAEEARVESVLGLARRLPRVELPKVEWAQADVTRDELVPHFRGADCVVHLAWKIQPSRDAGALRAANVDGSSRVFLAAAEAEVPSLVYASSVGAYSPGPKDRRVDESWPTDGIRTSFYSRHKAEVERILDRFEQERPGTRVVRLRPGLIFKREAATGIRRLFAGPFLPSPLLHPRLLPFVPDIPRLRFQGVHSRDVGEAYRLAIVGDVRGAFNVAAEPVLDPEELGRLLGARPVPVPRALARAAAALTWRLHLQPTPPGWLDLALGVPLLDVTRARDELGWEPRHTAGEALLELLAGMREAAGAPTPPLEAAGGRLRELAGGVGSRE
jgi:nucleoside-diphosphate-sugar epimerase